jgi:capsular polysaccharide biosynthesis protein
MWRNTILSRTLEGLTIIDILFILKKHLKIILACTVVFGLLSFIVSAFIIHPKYQSNASLIVNAKQSADKTVITISDLQLSQILVDTYTLIMKSTPVMEKIKNDLNLSVSTNALTNSISISGVGTTEIIQITVTNNDPVLAQNISSDLIKFGPEQIVKTMNTGSIGIISDASYSNIPVSPNIPLYVFIAVLIGIGGSFAYAIISELLDNTFKSEEDVSGVLGMNLLGIIPSIEDNK